MKKEYFKPTVKTVRMRTHSMLASSSVGEQTEEEQIGGVSKEEGDDIGW